MRYFAFPVVWFLLLSEMVAYLAPEKKLSQFSHETWNVTEGLCSNWVNGIVKDEHTPFVWVATPTGLARFDGVGFDTISSLDELMLQGGIWAESVDNDGNLILGTKSSGLLVYKNGKFVRAWGDDQEGPLEIRVIEVDWKNRIWMGSPSGLYCLEDGIVSKIEPQGKSFVWVEALHMSPDGKLWIGTQENGLYCFDETLTRVSLADEDVDGQPLVIHSIESDMRKNLWIGSKAGLFCYAPDGNVRKFTIEDGLPSNAVRSLYLDRFGCLWIGTEKGIARYFKNQLLISQSNAPFAKKYITCFCEDEEGSMWVGTKYSGFGQIWNAKFTVFGQMEGLADEVVNVVFEESDKSLLIGTNSGCFRLLNKAVEPVFEGTLGETRVRDIFRDTSGRLWVCTYSGAYYADAGSERLTAYTGGDNPDASLTSALTRQVMEASDGSIWIGTRSGLNRINGDGSVTQWCAPDIQNGFILDIIEDRTGSIWIGTDGGGVARLQADDTFEWVSTDEGLSSSVVFKIFEDHEGLFWLATTKGISIIREGNIYNIGPKEGLPSETIFQVLLDKYGYLWLTAHDGIFRIHRKSVLDLIEGGGEQLEVTRYGPLDGLRTYQMTGVGESQLLSDGNLAFATAKGVALLDPKSIQLNVFEPEVALKQITINGETIESVALDGGQPLVFKKGVKKLQIDYTSNSMIGANNIVFSTKLAGFDDETSVGRERSGIYTNLSPGDYAFVAKASNADGISGGERILFEFRVNPRFRQTIWFYLLIVLVSGGLAYVLYSLRLAKLKHDWKRLEREVSRRTEEIVAQKDVIEVKNLEIEKNLRDLESTNAELKKLNEEKSQFLGFAAHDMKNPLGNVMNLAELIAADEHLRGIPSHNEVADNLSLIQQSCRELLELVSSLVENIVLDSGEIRIEKDREDIAMITQSVVALNKPYADEKQQCIRYSGPTHLSAFVDGMRIRRAIDNYLSNATKYSPSGSLIDIQLSEYEKNGARWAKIEVRDEGPGLTDEDFEHVFERFAKLSAKPTGMESSSGLGLAIVKQIVEQHGGKANVVNRDSKGACFSFIVPLGGLG